jgi:uncharacterized protein (UPF0332 family)
MTTDKDELLQQARDSLAAAKLLLANGYAGYAAARSYYTMFYVVSAILLDKNLSFSKHSAVISGFGREFVKEGEVPTHFHRYLIEAQELRQMGDYGKSNEVTLDKAAEQIAYAEEFLEFFEQREMK